MEMTPQAAWAAYEQKNFETSEKIWLHILEQECDSERRNEYLAQYACVLVALERFEEARTLYRGLFSEKQDHRYLHQLSIIEREAAHLEEALHWLKLEQEILPLNDPSALAANLCEFARVHGLQGKPNLCRKYAEEAFHTSVRAEDTIVQAYSLRLLGDSFRDTDPATAQRYYEKAANAFNQANEVSAIEEIQSLLVELKQGTSERTLTTA